jgi:hypothetical protein
MSIPKLKVDRCDTIGMKHVDVERQYLTASIRKTTTVTFIPDLFYYGCIISTTLSILFSVLVVAISGNGTSDHCFKHNGYISNRIFVVPFPIFNLLYSCGLRNIPTFTNHFHHSLFGLFCSILYFSSSISLTAMSWWCSSAPEKADVFFWIVLSSIWVVAWTYFASKCFYKKYIESNPLQLLLFMRCVCIPPEIKKILLISPYFLVSGSIFINADQIRCGYECAACLLNRFYDGLLIIVLVYFVIAETRCVHCHSSCTAWWRL